MTPEQYQATQEAYLEIRECGAKVRELRMVELQNRTPELASQVRQLLNSESGDTDGENHQAH